MKSLRISLIAASAILMAGMAVSCGTTSRTTHMTDTTRRETDSRGHRPGSRAEATDAAADGILQKLAGEWTIVKAGNKAIAVTDEMPYVNFDISEGKVYASDGCNIINGDFSLAAGGKLTFDKMLATMRMCPEVENQQAIGAVLKDGRTFTPVFSKAATSDVTMLTLRDSAGKDALTLRRSDMNFLNGQWQVVKIGDKSFDNPEMNLFFDIPAMKVHGNTGCNYFNGDIYTDPTVGASLNFGQMGVTRMACPDQSTETAMLVALEQVSVARPEASGNVLLNDANGTTLIVLAPMKAAE